MARMEKQEANIIILSDDDDEKTDKEGKFQREEEKKEDTIVISDDDDEKENEVLSLGIVGKHSQLEAAMVAGASKDVKKEEIAGIVQSADRVLVCDEENEDESLKIVKEPLQLHGATGKTVQFQIEKAGDSLKGNNDSSMMDGKQSSKSDVCVVRGAANKEVDKIVQSVNTDLNSVQMTADNLVMRKLLRGPRYFDPQDSGSWETCSTRRKKPCFVCGSSEHGFKQCQKKWECYICKKPGHRARKCPEKQNDPLNDKLCLNCLCPGHDMSSCSYSYSLDDLKEIQCYVCKSFGHLCCAKFVNTSSRPLSCYRCGELGHTGLACNGLRKEDSTLLSQSSGYKFGGGAQIAREGKTAKKKRKRKETKEKRTAKKLRSETTDKASPGSRKLRGLRTPQCSSSIQAASKKTRKENKKQLRSNSAPRDHGKSQICRQTAYPVHFPDSRYGNIPAASSIPLADHYRYINVPPRIPPAWALHHHHNFHGAPSGQHLNNFRPLPSGPHINNFRETPSGQHINNFHVTPSPQQHTNFRWSRATASTPAVDHSRYDFVPPGISSVWTLDASRQNGNNFPAAPSGPQHHNFRWSRGAPAAQHYNNFSGGSHVSSSASSHVGFSALRFPSSRYGNSFGR